VIGCDVQGRVSDELYQRTNLVSYLGEKADHLRPCDDTPLDLHREAYMVLNVI
jgi:hypothetical protein